MSWIDIFLADGDPHKIWGADAESALSHMMRLRDLPPLLRAYQKAGIPLKRRWLFLGLDIARAIAYRRGFKAGASFPWPEEPL